MHYPGGACIILWVFYWEEVPRLWDITRHDYIKPCKENHSGRLHPASFHKLIKSHKIKMPSESSVHLDLFWGTSGRLSMLFAMCDNVLSVWRQQHLSARTCWKKYPHITLSVYLSSNTGLLYLEITGFLVSVRGSHPMLFAVCGINMEWMHSIYEFFSLFILCCQGWDIA